MNYTINNNDEVTLTLNRRELNACAGILSWGICYLHDIPKFEERLDSFRSLRDVLWDACVDLNVYNNPNFMEGDK